ncbi:MAG: nucleoside hydrolase [Anaerolineae bacterium]
MLDRTAVILDTDIGSDIDDAVCLAYLLRQPRCEMVGITTVSGDTGRRAALAEVVCRAAGREDVPIHAGAPGPLLTGPGQPNVPQYEAITSYPHRIDYPLGAAVEFLRQTIRARPHEITLLGIGPLTNLALLFASDPAIPALLKELVLMCGVFTAANGHGPAATEWNAMVDPLATAIVYRARPPRFTSIGLDVTTCCQLPADECRERFARAGGPLSIVAAMAEVWFRGARQITFHDPLAAAVLFEPDLCQYEVGEVDVEVVSPPVAGLTRFAPAPSGGPHRIAAEVDAGGFFDHYFATVGG